VALLLRGDYGRSIEMLRTTRRCLQGQPGEQYHYCALPHGLSEIYLELNLSEEAAEMATEGAALFENPGMGYETAKCCANLATAMGATKADISRHGAVLQSLRNLRQGKECRVAFAHRLYQALLLFNEGRYFESRNLCNAA